MLSVDVENKLHELGCPYSALHLNELVAYLREQLGIIVTVLPVGAGDDGNRFIGYQFAVFRVIGDHFIDDITDANQKENCNFDQVLIAGIEWAVRRYFIN